MRYILFFVTAILLTSPAQALRLSNCDWDNPHTIGVNYPGDNTEITLEAGMNRTFKGRIIQLRAPDGTIINSPRWDDEYCVWPDGKLRIQRRGFHRRR